MRSKTAAQSGCSGMVRGRAVVGIVLLLAVMACCYGIDSGETNAFASLLCDDETLPAVEVLASSIRAAGHDEPFLVVLPTSISGETVARVNGIENGHAFQAKSLPYPFNSTSDRMDIHKPCRYLKMQLWGLTEWSKIVFLDADTIVRGNVGELFEAPGFSAVKDPVGMNYNTGVIVIEPSRYVYSLIVKNYAHAGSYNVGDQGALNALVDFEAWNALPMRYNTFHSARADKLRAAKIVHYSGDAKPWNFWKASGQGHIGTRAFVEWCKHAERTATAACHMRGGVDARERGGPLRQHFDDYSREETVSVLLSTYSRETWRDLALFYAAQGIVQEVVIVWQNGARARAERPHAKVRFIYPDGDSLNNRYLSSDLASDCVYVCDDDVWPTTASFHSAFSVWRQNPSRLVGFYPRLWKSNPASYNIDIGKGYNTMLTKGMFAHRSFLTAYTLFLPRRLASIVDAHMNCEDILLSMLAAGMTGLPPLAVLSNATLRDTGKLSGISGGAASGHLRARAACVAQFAAGGMGGGARRSAGSVLPAARKNLVVGGGAARA